MNQDGDGGVKDRILDLVLAEIVDDIDFKP